MIPAVALGHPAAPLPVLPLGVPGADALDLDAVQMPTPSKRRGWRRPDMTGGVFVRPHEADEHAVTVNLFGKHGEGHRMILDGLDWEAVSGRFTTRWVRRASEGLLYVCSGVRAVAQVARQRAEVPCINLARFIAGAGPREIVRHVNGDRLDLRRCNLRIEPKARRRAKPAGVTHAG